VALKQIHKRERIWKARRVRKPEWQDRIPIKAPQKSTYRIAAANVGKFSRAFREAVSTLLETEHKTAFVEAWRGGNMGRALEAIPLFSDEGSQASARRFSDKLRAAYRDVIQASGEDAAARLKRDFGINLKFQIGGAIEKAKPKKPVWELIPVVPVNPYSVKWIEERGLELVKQGVTRQQVNFLRGVVQDGFERGLRAEEAYATIKANIGLTDREYQAVRNRKALLESRGVEPEQTEKLIDRYSSSLLSKRAERIARTETIAAEAQGRQTTWRLAQESGMLPEVERIWISAPPSGAPGRPCEICLELDGKAAPIDGSYDSIEGPIDGPPLHPQCRCSESLRKVQGA